MASRSIIEPLLAEFLTAHPELRLDLALDDGVVDIVKGGFDAGIRIGEMLDKDMIGLRVGADLRMAVVGSPAYFATHGKPNTRATCTRTTASIIDASPPAPSTVGSSSTRVVTWPSPSTAE